MKDIHTHILPGIDDGPKDFEESLEMLRIAERDGITDILLTPHIAEEFIYTLDKSESLFDELSVLASQNGIGVKLHRGYEVRLDKDLIARYTGEIKRLTVNGHGRHILLELPFMDIPVYLEEAVRFFTADNIVPIIVHPLRNYRIANNISIIYKLSDLGCLFQFNKDAVLDDYTYKTSHIVFRLLKEGLVHFIASDAHTSVSRTPRLSKAKMRIEKRFSNIEAEKIFEENPSALFEGREIEPFSLNESGFFDTILRKLKGNK